MPNRFSCLLAGLSVSLVLSSGCTPWGALPFNRDVARHEADEVAVNACRPSAEDTHNSDLPIEENFGERDFAQRQRNEAANNDFLLGRRAEDAGELEAARQLYQNVLRTHPTHAYAHHRLGVVADKMQRFAEAERHYQSALNYLSPENRQEISIVFSDLGYSYLLRGDFPRSERALTNALAYDENSRIAIRNLALLHGYRGDFQKAYQTFARVGGEAEARAELDRLFPHWQEHADTNPTPQPNVPPNSSLAANEAQQRPQTNSSTFPTSRAPQNRQFPDSTPYSSSQSSQHLTFNAGPTTDPETSNHRQLQTVTPQRTFAETSVSDQPFQAPQPTKRLASNSQGLHTASPARPAAIQLDASPSGGVTQATYASHDQRHPQHESPTAFGGQAPAPAASRIGVQIDEIQPEPAFSASRIALVLGGAVGPGGMFPTSQIEAPHSVPTPPSATTSHAAGYSTGIVQQVSAEVPGATPFAHDAQRQFPTTTTPPSASPTESRTGLIRSPNPPLDKTALIPTPNASEYKAVPLGNSRQPANPPAGSIPNPYPAQYPPNSYNPAQ